MQILDQFEQGSPEWYEARRGLITASEFSTVMAKGEGKTRKKYMYVLAGERFTGRVQESYTNAYMQRGRELEAKARELYQEQMGLEVKQVGFIKNGYTGFSPDGLVGEEGAIEIKVAIPAIQIERLFADKVPSEHLAQCQGGNYVANLQWIDFISYCEGLPLFIKRALRDQPYIDNLKSEVETFENELQEVVKKIGTY